MEQKVKLNSAPKVKKGKASPITVVLFLLLLVYALGLLLPIVWAVLIAFVKPNDFDGYYVYRAFDKYHFPTPKTWENFASAWKYLAIETPINHKEVHVLQLFGNSLAYSLGCAFFFTLCPLVVAYLTARFPFKFSKIVYGFVIVTMSLPIVGSMPSEIRMLKTLHIYDTIPSMWLLRFNFLSIYYLIFYAQFESIPKDYSEAAKIDGAGNFRIMTQVILPQAWNTIVTVFILSFITYWNDFQIPLLYIPEYPTAAYAIYYFVNVTQGGNITAEIPVQLAGTLIMTLPIIIVFLVFNRRIRVSVAMGGIKG